MAFIQAAQANNPSSSNLNITATFVASVAAGNSLIAAVLYENTDYANAGSDLSDPGSDTWTFRRKQWTVAHGTGVGIYDVLSSAGGFTTVTYRGATTAQAFTALVVFEVSGLSAVDTSNSNIIDTLGGGSTATNGDTTGSFTTTGTAGDLIIAAFSDTHGPCTWTAGTSPISFTIPTNGTASDPAFGTMSVEYGTQGSAGAINPAITCSLTDPYVAVGISYKLTSGGTTYPVSRSVSQTQTLSLSKQIRPTRSIAQSQTLSLAKQSQLVRTIVQPQLVTITQGVRRTLALTQAQVATLVRQSRLSRALVQAQAAALSFLIGHVYPISGSTSVTTTATLSYSLAVLPGPMGTAIVSQPPGSGGAGSNYQDWPVLIITPGEPLPPVGGAIGGP